MINASFFLAAPPRARLLRQAALCLLLAWLLGGWSLFALAAPVTVTDATGRTVTLAVPPQRIVSLAPHTTEMLFSAGAGERIVATVDFSDYPAAARALPRIGGYSRFDLEALVALRPDLVVGWQGGNNRAALERVAQLGIPLFLSEPHRLGQIADEIDTLAVLAGTTAVAQPRTAAWRARLAQLRKSQQGRASVGVMYEIWNQPLMTVNGEHIISDVMALCGARNVFAQLPTLAAQISVEAVLAADPQVIIASGMGEERPEWLEAWRHWPRLRAVRENHLYFIPPDLLQRHTLRILDGAEQMCARVEQARQYR